MALTTPFPSLADVFYLAVYPLFAIGLLMLGRARSPAQGELGINETLLLTVGAGLLAWVFLITPTWAAYDEPLLTRLVGVAYPFCDLLLFVTIDDYGTGHSSLAYLQQLPVGRLKIDRSFVTEMIVDDAGAAIVRSTIELARGAAVRRRGRGRGGRRNPGQAP